MPSMKVIRRRFASVTTTKKIMKAMNMVAAARLQKDKARLEAARPFFHESKRIMDDLKTHEDAMGNIFLKPREVKNTAYLIITSDRGLCGNYNTNLAEKALRHMEEIENEKILAVGVKGYEYFKRRGKNVLHRFDDVLETAYYEDAERIGDYLSGLYSSGAVDEVYMAYTQFESALTHVPQIVKLLPIGSEPDIVYKIDRMIYDPDFSSYVDYVVPVYLNSSIYAALLESSACEQSARMLSMDTAVNNASDIMGKLTRLYNRKRQTSITQEIIEIVSSTGISKQRGD